MTSDLCHWMEEYVVENKVYEGRWEMLMKSFESQTEDFVFDLRGEIVNCWSLLSRG